MLFFLKNTPDSHSMRNSWFLALSPTFSSMLLPECAKWNLPFYTPVNKSSLQDMNDLIIQFNYPIQRLIEANPLGQIYAIQRNHYISSVCSFNSFSTGLIVWTSACVVSVWVCKHCGNPRPGTVWSGIWGGTTSLPLSFNYGRRRRGGRGSHFNENGPHHKSRSDQVHPQFRLKDSKHRDKIDRTSHHSKHTR